VASGTTLPVPIVTTCGVPTAVPPEQGAVAEGRAAKLKSVYVTVPVIDVVIPAGGAMVAVS